MAFKLIKSKAKRKKSEKDKEKFDMQDKKIKKLKLNVLGKNLVVGSDKEKKGERGFTFPFGYQEEDAYLFLGQKKVVCFFDVLIQYGTFNPAPIGWLLNIIPREEIESGKVMFFQKQRGMDRERESEIIETEIETNVTTMMNSGDGKSSKENTQKISRIHDMKIAGQLSGKNDTIVDSNILLRVEAESAEKVEKAIAELKEAYKHYAVKGVLLIRRTGEQMEDLENLFTHIKADAWHSSDMATVAAGRIFLPSSGFSDTTGTYVGTDISALLSNNPSIIDFTGVNNAVVFMGGVSVFGSIAGMEGGAMFQNSGSAVAHVISEANYLSGKRVHHIVLSQFSYHSSDSLVFDMSKESINPLETFGTPETVQLDATANFNKATAVMLLLSNVANEERYAELEVELKRVLVDWFIHNANNSGMYTKNPESEPNRARRILATGNHKNYPTPYDLLPALKTNVAKRKTDGEKAGETADFLYNTLSTAFNEFPNIFHKETTLPDVYKATDRNIYYDISALGSNKKIASAVFLNVLAYVTNRALEGEQIIIHGLDKINVPVDLLTPYKDRIDRKNIGLITVFEESESEVNPKSYAKFSGRLTRQDAVVLGGLTEDELMYINQSWRKELPVPVANKLLEANNGILYFYRKRDRVGALVNTHLIL